MILSRAVTVEFTSMHTVSCYALLPAGTGSKPWAALHASTPGCSPLTARTRPGAAPLRAFTTPAALHLTDMMRSVCTLAIVFEYRCS